MTPVVPFWIEVVVAVLLVVSGLFTLVATLGLVRIRDFFQRLHPPALGYTIASWCVTLSCILYFSFSEKRLALEAWSIIILLSITVPITTVFLSRTAIFRMRSAGDPNAPPMPKLREETHRDTENEAPQAELGKQP